MCVCACMDGCLLRTWGYWILLDVGGLVLQSSDRAGHILNHRVIFQPATPYPLWSLCLCVRCVFGCLHALTRVEVGERRVWGAIPTLFETGSCGFVVFLRLHVPASWLWASRIPLSHLMEHWNYRPGLLCLAFWGFRGLELRSLHLLGKHFTHGAMSPASFLPS